MDDELFRLTLAQYEHAVRNRLPEEGKLERQLKVAFATAQADTERLRAALEAVEFDDEGTCPWCREWDAHTADCQRQAALGA